MAADGVETVVARYGAELKAIDEYEEDDFKYNPFGGIYLAAVVH